MLLMRTVIATLLCTRVFEYVDDLNSMQCEEGYNTKKTIAVTLIFNFFIRVIVPLASVNWNIGSFARRGLSFTTTRLLHFAFHSIKSLRGSSGLFSIHQ